MEVEAQKNDAARRTHGIPNLSELRRVLDFFVERPNPRRAFQQPKLVGFGPKLNSISRLPRQVAYRAIGMVDTQTLHPLGNFSLILARPRLHRIEEEMLNAPVVIEIDDRQLFEDIAQVLTHHDPFLEAVHERAQP